MGRGRVVPRGATHESMRSASDALRKGGGASVLRIVTNVTSEVDYLTECNQNRCPRPIGMYVNRHDGSVLPIPCNRWDCPHCGPIKKNRVADRVKRGFRLDSVAGNRVRAMTLTQKLGTEQYIMDCWSRFRALLAKRGIHLKYFWSKEFTVKGERHMHVLINAYIPQEIIKECWLKATKGESYIVWITGKELPDSEKGDIYNPAGYATKYLTKSYSEDCRFEKNERRFGFSRYKLFKVQKCEYFTSLSTPDFWDAIACVTSWRAEIEYHTGDYNDLPKVKPDNSKPYDAISDYDYARDMQIAQNIHNSL